MNRYLNFHPKEHGWIVHARYQKDDGFYGIFATESEAKRFADDALDVFDDENPIQDVSVECINLR